jgi:drug/metabolite transporter (DMT)-like permease
MVKNIRQQKAYGLALVAVLFWSTMSSAFKITLQYVPVDGMLLGSVSTGILVLFLVNRLGKEPLKLSQLTKSALFSSALMGLFNPFLYYLVLFKAYDLLEAQEAGTLNYIWPIVLVLLSIPALKQKIHWQALLAILISFGGILVISTHGKPWMLHFSNPVGVGLAVGSAVFWAVYWILNMKDTREETGKILLNLVFGWLYLVIYLLITDWWPAFPVWQGVLGCIYVGIFEMSIIFVVWLKALNYSVDTAKVSNLIYLSPFLGLFWIHQTVGENIHLYTVVGLVFIISGIVMQSMGGKVNKKR